MIFYRATFSGGKLVLWIRSKTTGYGMGDDRKPEDNRRLTKNYKQDQQAV